jgi:hypothetical protein
LQTVFVAVARALGELRCASFDVTVGWVCADETHGRRRCIGEALGKFDGDAALVGAEP